MSRTEKYYKRQLIAYFYAYYKEYENDSEWFVDPAPNKIKGYIPGLSMILTLTCDEDGEITEERELVELEVEKLYDVVECAMRGSDALYEDYLKHLITEDGFNLLRKEKLLESCGSIDGRNLYVLRDY